MRTRTVTWGDPFAIMQNGVGKTGLESLREMFTKKLPAPPISELIGFSLVQVDEGSSVFEGVPGEYLYNPIGVVHGGFAMTLLDSAMGVAVHSTLGVGERYTTLELKTNFVRPITVDTGTVRAEGKVIHRGKSTAVAEASLTAVQTGKLLAYGTTTCLIIPTRSA